MSADVLFLDLGAGFTGVFACTNLLSCILMIWAYEPTDPTMLRILWYTEMLLESLSHPSGEPKSPRVLDKGHPSGSES